MIARRRHTYRASSLLAACVASIVPAACSSASTTLPPLGQIVLYVDTDAPVALASARNPTLDAPIPLFDRVQFEVLPPGATAPCASCTNSFLVDDAKFTAHRVSVGIPLPNGQEGWRVRVTLYVDRFASASGDPDRASAITTTVTLPAVATEGIAEASIFLSTDDVGQSKDGNVVLGAPSDSHVGSWPSAARVKCSAPRPSPTMTCIPGGAFWMGAPGDHLPIGRSPSWHRLVVLSPFYLDGKEVSALAVRASSISTGGYDFWGGGTTGSDSNDWCTISPDPSARDALPASCMRHGGAAAYCQSRGVSLPSEAQLEYAMGGATMQPYVWGRDPPGCDDAVWGRNGIGYTETLLANECRDKSNYLGVLGGPEIPATTAHDRLDVLTTVDGAVYDLNGNVAEWAVDHWQFEDEPCWASMAVLHDPVCTQPGRNHNEFVAKGGSWTDGGVSLESYARYDISASLAPYPVGFRCSAPGR